MRRAGPADFKSDLHGVLNRPRTDSGTVCLGGVDIPSASVCRCRFRKFGYGRTSSHFLSPNLRSTNLAMDAPAAASLFDGEDEGEDRSFVEEAAEISAIVQRVANSEGKDAEIVYDRWKQIVSDVHGDPRGPSWPHAISPSHMAFSL